VEVISQAIGEKIREMNVRQSKTRTNI